MKSVFSNKRDICVFVLPTVVLFIAIVLIPIIMSGQYSLLKWDGIGDGTFIGLQNYVKLFDDQRVVKAIGNSLLFAGASVFIQLPISLILAMVLASGVRGEKVYCTIYFIPVVISTTVIGQLWMKIYNADYGLLNTFLGFVGLGSLAQDWLGQKTTALVCAFVPILWQYVGYHMLIMYAGIKSISPDIYEAAKIDGASGIRAAFSITVPMLMPILKVSLTFSVIGAVKVFDLIYVLTGGGPFLSTEVPSTYMYTTIFDSGNYGYGSAVAMFIVIECLILSLAVDRLFKKRLEEVA